MPLLDLNLEDLQDDYRALLEEQLPGALDEVTAYYEAKGKPLALLPIAITKSGNVPIPVLSRVFQEWPALTVEAVSARPGEEDYTMAVDLIVTVWVLEQDTEVVDSLAHRYAWAVASVVNESKPHAVQELAAPPSIEVALTEVAEYAGYLKGAQISVPLKVSANM